MTDQEKEKLLQLQKEKERRISEYLALQDRADALNEEIYKTCCGIETLNGQIEQAKDAARKAAEKARRKKKAGSPPANGTHEPPKA